MPPMTRRAALSALAPAYAGLCVRAVRAAEPQRPPAPGLVGAYALPDGQAKVAATLSA